MNPGTNPGMNPGTNPLVPQTGNYSAEKAIRTILSRGIDFLRQHETEPAQLLAERLLEGLLSCKRFELYLNAERLLSSSQIETYFAYLRQRVEGVPSQYILGRADFMDFTFQVGPPVLIPRPETELLVEKVLDHVAALSLRRREIEILDLGTGSGNIAVSLASYLPKACVWAVDISEEALKIAKLNAMRNEVGHRIKFLPSDLFSGLAAGQKFDLLVSNPPYLSRKDMQEIPQEVAKEPSSALFGGEDGTEIIRRIVNEAPVYLKKNGLLFFEIGAEQGACAAQLLHESGWNHYQIFKDYSGFDRVVMAWIS